MLTMIVKILASWGKMYHDCCCSWSPNPSLHEVFLFSSTQEIGSLPFSALFHEHSVPFPVSQSNCSWVVWKRKSFITVSFADLPFLHTIFFFLINIRVCGFFFSRSPGVIPRYHISAIMLQIFLACMTIRAFFQGLHGAA